MLHHIPSGTPRKFMLEATVNYPSANKPGGGFFWSRESDQDFCFLHLSQGQPTFQGFWMANNQNYMGSWNFNQPQNDGPSMITVSRGTADGFTLNASHQPGQPCRLRLEVDLDLDTGSMNRGGGTIYVNGQKVGDLTKLAGSLDDGKIGLFSTESATFRDVRLVVFEPDEPFPPAA